MNFSNVLESLDLSTKTWASTLTTEDLSLILTTVYKIPTFVNIIKTSTVLGSAEIGQLGESNFEELCKQLPHNYVVHNTSKHGKQGDFIIECKVDGKLYRCLVDIKNYKTTIPKKEIEKFFLDMTFGSYDAGIMISLGTKFVGIDQNIHIENKILSYGQVPIMYLSELPSELILKCIEVLFVKTQVTMEKQTNFSRIENSIAYINLALSQSGTTRRILSELQQTISGQIQKCQEQLISLEVQIKQAIREMTILNNQTTLNNPSNLLNQTTSTTLTTLNTLNTLNTTPVETKREDNLADQTLPNKAQVDPEQYVIDYSKYFTKDINLIQQIADLRWDNIDDHTTYTLFESTDLKLNIIIDPLVTRTKIYLQSYEEPMSDTFKNQYANLIALFKWVKKTDQYEATLTQNIVNSLNLIL